MVQLVVGCSIAERSALCHQQPVSFFARQDDIREAGRRKFAALPCCFVGMHAHGQLPSPMGEYSLSIEDDLRAMAAAFFLSWYPEWGILL